jgi:hypothetical protein
MAVKALESLKADGNDPTAVLEAATLKGWRGLFPVNTSAPPVVLPIKKRCAYCERLATSTPNRTPACDLHFRNAMDHDPVKAA